jgi:Uncharacterized protein conserved in bacteria (DUF2066)
MRIAGRSAIARVGLALCACLTLVAPCASGAGEDAPFTVGNYPVEARAENAVSAKSKALADGQQAALHSLLKRLVPVTAHQRLQALRQVPAGDLVEGVRVRSERNSSTDYIASLDFTFQAQGVRDLLRREGVPFVEEQAPVLTLIPLWRGSGRSVPNEEAAWSNVWKGLDLEHALTPVRLEPLKKQVPPEAVNALADGDGSALRALIAAYGGELVLLAVADQDLPAKRLSLTLTGRDAAGAFVLKRTYRIDPADPGYASELAAVVSLGILEGRWKALKGAGAGADRGVAAPGAPADSALLLAIEFRGMSEWQDISRKLAATPGVEELEVAGLSARGARVTLRYAAGAERLADALASQGLSLRNAGGTWVLSQQ